MLAMWLDVIFYYFLLSWLMALKIIRKKKLNLAFEKKLWQKGYSLVCGIDEVGRGPLAGPVVAAAVIVNPKSKARSSKQSKKSKNKAEESIKTETGLSLWKKLLALVVFDSKQLTEKQRKTAYKKLIKSPFIDFGIGAVSEKEIDKINIKNAAEKAMFLAVKKLKAKPDFLIIDGNNLKNEKLLRFRHKLVVKGDGKIFSVAAASIIAKVFRDRLMVKRDKKYPQYGFKINKGYPSPFHLKALKKYGPSKIHRQSFAPVKETIAKIKKS